LLRLVAVGRGWSQFAAVRRGFSLRAAGACLGAGRPPYFPGSRAHGLLAMDRPEQPEQAGRAGRGSAAVPGV